MGTKKTATIEKLMRSKNRLQLYYDTRPTRFNRKKYFLPNVIYVDVLPNPTISAKDVCKLLQTRTSDVVVFINDKLFKNEVLLTKKFNQIQNHLCHTSARVYIINSPLLVYDLYHKMNPDKVHNDKMHFEEINLFKVKAEHHFLIEVGLEAITTNTTSTTTGSSTKDSVIQKQIHQVCSRFVHVKLIKINGKHFNWEQSLLSKLLGKLKT